MCSFLSSLAFVSIYHFHLWFPYLSFCQFQRRQCKDRRVCSSLNTNNVEMLSVLHLIVCPYYSSFYSVVKYIQKFSWEDVMSIVSAEKRSNVKPSDRCDHHSSLVSDFDLYMFTMFFHFSVITNTQIGHNFEI